MDAKNQNFQRFAEAVDIVIFYIGFSKYQDVQHFNENFRYFKELIILKQYQSYRQINFFRFEHQ